ncbi:MAG TPA: plastocyanin/azurin family copper-binding protein [Candidatus Limnocylindria bacterium]|nr:plastocyanin/azurin family copper-binding protein [Candidatus Limnocylindria bacterium]
MLKTDPMRRRLVLGAGLVSLVLAASACASGSASSAPAATQTTAESMAPTESAAESAAESMAEGPSVTITSTSSFGATEVTVPAGETLTVINNSGAPHTFTEGQNGNAAADARVDEQIAVGASVPITFPEPGDYDVTCLFHSTMNMVVHVE